DPRRDNYARRAVPTFVELETVVGRLQVDFARTRGTRARFRDEAGGGIDCAGSADRDEEIALAERAADLVHMQGHLAEPHDVRPKTSNATTIGTGVAFRKVAAARRNVVAELAADLKQFAVHMDNAPRARALVQIINVLRHECEASSHRLERRFETRKRE